MEEQCCCCLLVCINEAVFVRYSSILEADTVSSKSQSDMIDELALK